ncbi:unnamed protein product [Aphanomyces euteiches]|uniref:Uncharacterized protein n=1 Tax=Aphanomyces euteiches TaxID=100861 RepID=A0A6G0XIR0_9STRA|nr:hypothetical protein Ae201684_004237 [Aphanomyces euteiches]KAH9093387.1 hypothetical protein Ae201684P_016017 [Aphanomyces euteiches]KAH9107952.1 hypothetical protein AeMF1_016773 [Aphanomyces euteiches]KAH9117146.1 hypothetical protein LEN26_012800 [Aphanomyces euteiches]KAH9140069.1 hypothetical protein AeRB84_015676 [Aphanomyces euteiches]
MIGGTEAMEQELASLQGELERVQKAKALALAQIETLMVEQKALQAKRDADLKQQQRAMELEANSRAAAQAATSTSFTEPPKDVARSPHSDTFIDAPEVSELDELEAYLRNY